MSNEILTFGNIRIEKKEMLSSEDSYFFLKNDIGKVLISNCMLLSCHVHLSE